MTDQNIQLGTRVRRTITPPWEGVVTTIRTQQRGLKPLVIKRDDGSLFYDHYDQVEVIFTAKDRLIEIGDETVALAQQIHLELNSRMNEAGSAKINWNDVGTMGYVKEQLDQVAHALGLQEVA